MKRVFVSLRIAFILDASSLSRLAHHPLVRAENSTNRRPQPRAAATKKRGLCLHPPTAGDHSAIAKGSATIGPPSNRIRSAHPSLIRFTQRAAMAAALESGATNFYTFDRQQAKLAKETQLKINAIT